MNVEGRNVQALFFIYNYKTMNFKLIQKQFFRYVRKFRNGALVALFCTETVLIRIQVSSQTVFHGKLFWINISILNYLVSLLL